MFNFFRNCQIVFQNGGIILYSYQQCMKVEVALTPHQHLVLSFKILAILLGIQLYFIMVLISNALMTNDFKYLFMCFLTIHMSSSVKCLFKSFDHFFKNQVVCDFLLSYNGSLYILDIYLHILIYIYCTYIHTKHTQIIYVNVLIYLLLPIVVYL